MKKILVVLSLLVLSITGCSKSVDVQLASEVKVYFSEERDKTMKLNDSDDEYQLLQNWLNENKEGWYKTSGKYRGGIYMKSGDQGLQVTTNRVVLYAIHHGEPNAVFVQNIEKQDLRAFKQLAEKVSE